MTPSLLIFGLGYSSSALARRVEARGWTVSGTTRDGRGGTLRFSDHTTVHAALRSATHILSSVPPEADGQDPVLAAFGEAIAFAPARWVGYLSSTGVYGDAGGAWVDETAPLLGRRAGRIAADLAWQALRKDVRIFRLPGIYGPGRSAIDRVLARTAHRVDLPDQIFSRIHVADIVSAVIASMDNAVQGVFNIADDLPTSQNDVVTQAARLIGLPPPPFVSLDSLSPMARAFYAENRRVANGRAKRLLGWTPQFPTYREGLRSLISA
ncbi:MAG: SDR family oxidoreductase [Sphingopyxis sp.]|nr:SDR family oxidoreductase [Sphingopyxis sp.]